eukprot:s524_g30.t1
MKVKPSPQDGSRAASGLDTVVPALAQTVQRLESLQRQTALGENSPKAPQLAQLLENARTLSNQLPKTQPQAAAALRQRLVEFEQFAPRDAVDVPRRTMELLARWRSAVSRQEVLNKEESAEVLGALLRGERAIAELQRAEAACARRWAAMSQEAHQLVDRIKGFKGRAQVCQERQRNMTMAAGHQRKELWSQQLSRVQIDDRGAAQKVYDELLKLDAQCQQLSAAIWSSKGQLHKLDYKRRQALRVLDSSLDFSEQSEGAAGLSVDDVVETELEVEKLLWELFYLEREKKRQDPRADMDLKIAQPVSNESHPAHDIAMDSLPPTVAPASPSFAGQEPPDVLAEVASVVDATPPPDGLPVEPVAENPVVTPRVANLIHRLSMSRDERRQHERERKAGRWEDPPDSSVPKGPSTVTVTADAQSGDAPVEPPPEPPVQMEASRWPELPEPTDIGGGQGLPVQPEALPWKTSSPEVIWGELPSIPLIPPALQSSREALPGPIGSFGSNREHRVVLEWDT